jgi:hypothetical protein
MKKVLFCLLLVSTVAAQAEVSQTMSMAGTSNRLSKKVGITTGFGSPFPSLLGLNLNYHVTDYMKATAGYGEISVSSSDETAKVSTIGAGADFFIPGWSLSPTAGVHVSKVDVSKTAGADLSIQGIDESATIAYAQAGLDWQSSGGFNIGLGAVAGSGKASGSYMNLGWYF